MSTPNAKHVIGLDILRLVAATLVMSYHFGFWNWLHEQPLARILPDQAPDWGLKLNFGWIGVEIFFVISGFVIAYTASTTDQNKFLRGRFLRLAPANWIGATVVLAIYTYMGHKIDYLLVIKYVKTLLFWPLDAIDGVWWTLGIEIDFYIFVYILIRKNFINKLERVTFIIGLLSGLFWTLALSVQIYLQNSDGTTGVLYYLVTKAEGNRELQLLLVQHGCLFGLGVALWKASTIGLTKRRIMAILVLTGACILEIVGQNGIIARSCAQNLSSVPAILFWVAAVGFFVLSVFFNEPLIKLIGRGSHLVRFFGLTTYPLYLVHDAIGAIVISTAWKGIRDINIDIGCGIFVAFVFAGIIAAVIEPWTRGILSKLWPTSQKAYS